VDVNGACKTQSVEIPAPASVIRLQWITIAWMCVELLIAGFAGIRACSVALTAFASDSAIELLSAAAVLYRFRVGISAEKSAARITAVLLYLLAGFIAFGSAFVLLSHRFQPFNRNHPIWGSRSPESVVCIFLSDCGNSDGVWRKGWF
jgi:divalent metal cation (Fe/Co/Zn/Cd) transporter